MRLFRPLVVLSSLLISSVIAQDAPDVPKQKHTYQSDVTRLRKIVINSLYSHRDIFLRELISNANDALEKLRLSSLTDKSIVIGDSPLNITIKGIKDEDGPGGRIIITDYGIGMSPEELTNNLGTLAKSGTSEFLSKAETLDTTGQGNLIGAFGLGFYSSFLVADRVFVASVPAKSDKNPDPQQYVFSSSAEDPSFEVYPDPRGNTLGRGTEITLILKEDATEYVESYKLGVLVEKHSGFSSSFPIYLYSRTTEEVPDVDEAEVSASTDAESATESSESTDTATSEASEETPQSDEDEAIVEDAAEPTTPAEETKPTKMKTVVHEDWIHLNAQQPLWQRDPKDITDEEYMEFYRVTFKDAKDPLAWHHFSGDAGTGSAFKAILYVPSSLPSDFWNGHGGNIRDIRIYNKRVFITNDLGEDPLPKWMSWLKAIVDAEDLPLNVSREMLQNSKFLRQIKQVLTRRLIQLFQKIAQDDPKKYEEIYKALGGTIKLGAVEGETHKQKLAALARFPSNQRNFTSLEEYVLNKKKGQDQIFFLAGLGQPVDMLKGSLFIEKLDARGYEVLLVNEPLDEFVFSQMRTWEKLIFQDVTKMGLKFGDEDEDPEEEKQKQATYAEKFEPLIEYLKNETANSVMNVIISNRLVVSPCAIVTPTFGYSANMERLMNAQNSRQNNFMPGKLRVLEINPASPLIEGLLKRVQQLPGPDEDPDPEAEAELKEVVMTMVDGALVRSGFDVQDVNQFFARVDKALRRSLGVSENAKVDATVRPAPPVDPNPIADAPEEPKPSIELPDHLKGKIEVDMEAIPDDEDDYGNKIPHDEL